jgi:hypothetical protein
MKSACKKAERISADMLSQAASLGVARAVEARKAAGVELSRAEVGDVSGGGLTLLADPWIRGYPPMVNMATAAAINPAVNPVLPAAALGAVALV